MTEQIPGRFELIGYTQYEEVPDHDDCDWEHYKVTGPPIWRLTIAVPGWLGRLWYKFLEKRTTKPLTD